MRNAWNMLSRFSPSTAVWVSRKAAATIDRVRLIGASSRYSTTAMATSQTSITMSAAMPRRNSPGDSRMLAAVARGSPRSISRDRTASSAKRPQKKMVR